MGRREIDRRTELELEALLAQERARAEGDADEQQRTVQRARPQGGAAGGTWAGIVEQRILDGMERGLFDNLRGMGRPLNLDEDQFVPEEMKMAFRMLQSTGLTPLWVQVNKEIREDIERTYRFRGLVQQRRDGMSPIEWSHRRKEYVERIRDINDKIMNHNILAPSSHVHLPLLRLDEELARFDADADDSRAPR